MAESPVEEPVPRLGSQDPGEDQTTSDQPASTTDSTIDGTIAITTANTTASTTTSSTASTADSTTTTDSTTAAAPADPSSPPAPPTSLALSGPRPQRRRVLLAPALSLSLGGGDSLASEDLPLGLLSPDPEDAELDRVLDGMATPSDTESMAFPSYDADMLDEMRRLGVASSHRRVGGPAPGAEAGLGCLEDEVDDQGTRWRRFSPGDEPQESRVNMSLIQPFLKVLSHGGYYGDGMNDIIVFSSCYLPENSLENYQSVMDHLFRYVVGTLDLMVSQDYAVVYLCAGGQKEKLPGIGWLRDCYTTIQRRLRKNLKALYVLHPTWYIKALITFIKPFISSKFSRKLQFVSSLSELSLLVPTEHVQIPDCVKQWDQSGPG
ncbi:bcl-2/adenovirus E1B 19 kDa-interacting protein 2-like protein isoform X1 [Gadus macrocephalus]|uniref:bcl-2/adenovirus E1B 19 kDa-interacting protein 2-like protein isoform X1 n=1 Tax=Gadus macrocephalus TaxID=80720 RepID=UPI0028CB9C62|nr:bcl-2/adenovirus E1B 19 kDa-interacting protein 2-like protein isoform X1 [Gadus macrocephalus]